jgi:hypothetical protein
MEACVLLEAVDDKDRVGDDAGAAGYAPAAAIERGWTITEQRYAVEIIFLGLIFNPEAA